MKDFTDLRNKKGVWTREGILQAGISCDGQGVLDKMESQYRLGREAETEDRILQVGVTELWTRRNLSMYTGVRGRECRQDSRGWYWVQQAGVLNKNRSQQRLGREGLWTGFYRLGREAEDVDRILQVRAGGRGCGQDSTG